jgi:hypothetical protein
LNIREAGAGKQFAVLSSVEQDHIGHFDEFLKPFIVVVSFVHFSDDYVPASGF